MKRNNLTAEEAEKRIRSQLSNDERISIADRVGGWIDDLVLEHEGDELMAPLDRPPLVALLRLMVPYLICSPLLLLQVIWNNGTVEELEAEVS